MSSTAARLARAPDDSSPTLNDLVGAWEFEQVEDEVRDGDPIATRAPQLSGTLVCSPDGYVSIIFLGDAALL